MMKTSDVSVAVTLLIGGMLHHNGDDGELPKILRAIVQECADWGESLPDDEWAFAMSAAHRQVTE